MSNWIEQTVDTILNHIFFFQNITALLAYSKPNGFNLNIRELWFNAQAKSILGLKQQGLESSTIVGLNGEVATKAKRAK